MITWMFGQLKAELLGETENGEAGAGEQILESGG